MPSPSKYSSTYCCAPPPGPPLNRYDTNTVALPASQAHQPKAASRGNEIFEACSSAGSVHSDNPSMSGAATPNTNANRCSENSWVNAPASTSAADESSRSKPNTTPTALATTNHSAAPRVSESPIRTWSAAVIHRANAPRLAGAGRPAVDSVSACVVVITTWQGYSIWLFVLISRLVAPDQTDQCFAN